MFVLDENIDEPQRRQIEAWKLHVRQIGVELGRLGMKDRNEIIPLLHALRHPTFFTRDSDFYHPWLRHPGYCLVYLEVAPGKTAEYLRRFLRHPAFRSHVQRMGNLVRVHPDGLTVWPVSVPQAYRVEW